MEHWLKYTHCEAYSYVVWLLYDVSERRRRRRANLIGFTRNVKQYWNGLIKVCDVNISDCLRFRWHDVFSELFGRTVHRHETAVYFIVLDNVTLTNAFLSFRSNVLQFVHTSSIMSNWKFLRSILSMCVCDGGDDGGLNVCCCCFLRSFNQMNHYYLFFVPLSGHVKCEFSQNYEIK